MECKIVAIGERLENRSLVDLELGLVQEVTAEVEFTRPRQNVVKFPLYREGVIK